jgi:plasmid stability protein
LNIKNLPDALYRKLQARAKRQHRSVAQEVTHILAQAVEHQDYLPLVAPIFEETARGERELVTSAVTLLGLLVVPYRAGHLALAERYQELLTRSRGWNLVDLDRGQLRMAAQLRALHRIQRRMRSSLWRRSRSSARRS